MRSREKKKAEEVRRRERMRRENVAEKGERLRLILCIVRVTGGRRSLCKFFQEKPGWTAAKNDDELEDDFNKIFREGADDSSRGIEMVG